MDLHLAVRDVVDRVGAGVLDDADSFRGVLDDVLDEDTADPGDVNLLVDAVRFGCFDQLLRLLDTDADPALAVATVGAGLARLRGGADERAASWACAVLGFAVRRVPDGVVRELASQDAPVTTVVAPSPTPPADERASRPRAGRRLAVRLGATAFGVAGAGLVLLLALDGRTTPEAADDETTRANSDASGAGEALCWNGEPAADVADCSVPTDDAGLAWVFPASDDPTCDPQSPGPTTKVVERYCPMVLAAGGDVQVHYSQWRDHAWMVDRYEGVRLDRDFDVGRSDLAAYAIEAPDGLRKAVLFYRDPDAPFSVTVYAESDDDLYTAVGQLMIRPVEHLRGLGPGQEALPASLAVEPRPID